ncbi:MAG: MetQ/NlpA family ABC transporter substrate-binding protein [Bacillota bacterium]|jgi:D-methionine transport system substrate-binding protein
MRRIRIIVLLLMVVFATVLAGCSQPQEQDPNPEQQKLRLKVGATAVPHAEILEFVQPVLEEQGIVLEIVVFNDYVQPNLALSQGQLDANFFQHIPYLEAFKSDHKLDLTAVGKVHIEPMGIYSSKITDISQLPVGAQIAIPNDVSQVGRALALLAKHQLIQLKEGVGVMGTVEDVVQNPLQLKITLLDAATLPRVLNDPQVNAAVINGNFALEADLNPVEDAILLEDGDSPYANVLVVKTGRESEEVVQALMEALQSEAVKQFIQERYQGAVLPV